jgi:diguanylate cyclase (GGDEF)-like protein
LYSVFEFARADIQYLGAVDVMDFVGRRLLKLIPFDAAAFYLADLEEGQIVAQHVVGPASDGLLGLTLRLEQKLTGWVAANNQALCNLPPFPDFLKATDFRTQFQISAIAPINRAGKVLGAISLYRQDKTKFTEDEFRRLEIVCSQTAIILNKLQDPKLDVQLLFDPSTGLPNSFQLYLMFDQVATDAVRYDYCLALMAIHLDDVRSIRRRWGHLSGDEAIKSAAKHLAGTLRDADLLVRYADDEFIALTPKMTREQAEALRSRVQNELDHLRFSVRANTVIPVPASIGIAVFPEDGDRLENLLSVAEFRMLQDLELRDVIQNRVRHIGTE